MKIEIVIYAVCVCGEKLHIVSERNTNNEAEVTVTPCQVCLKEKAAAVEQYQKEHPEEVRGR